jgi:hypothetical protein
MTWRGWIFRGSAHLVLLSASVAVVVAPGSALASSPSHRPAVDSRTPHKLTPPLPSVPRFTVDGAIVLSRGMVELVVNGTVVVRHSLLAEGTFTIPMVTAIVDEPDWISETAPGVYTLQAPLIAGPGTSLDVAAPAVTSLRLVTGLGVFIGGEQAQATFDHVLVTSWNKATGSPMTTPTPGRPFVLFQNRSQLVINASTMSDLGSTQVGARGVTWKSDPQPGGATNSVFSGSEDGATVIRSGPVKFSGDTFSSNFDNGLRVASGTSSTDVVNDRASGNQGAGFAIDRGVGRSSVLGSVADANSVGFLVRRTGAAILKSNMAEHNSSVGVALWNADNTTLQSTRTTENGIGVSVSGASYKVSLVDLASRNDTVGLRVSDSFVPELSDVRINHASQVGIVADSPRLSVSNAGVTSSPVGIYVKENASFTRSTLVHTERGIAVWPKKVLFFSQSTVHADGIGVELGAGSTAYLIHDSINAPEATRGGTVHIAFSKVSHGAFQWLLFIPGAGLLLYCILLEFVSYARQRRTPRRPMPKHIWNVT